MRQTRPWCVAAPNKAVQIKYKQIVGRDGDGYHEAGLIVAAPLDDRASAHNHLVTHQTRSMTVSAN
eukprot:scaffold35167_cov33-Tisochrysis_lutea.AAC.4